MRRLLRHRVAGRTPGRLASAWQEHTRSSRWKAIWALPIAVGAHSFAWSVGQRASTHTGTSSQKTRFYAIARNDSPQWFSAMIRRSDSTRLFALEHPVAGWQSDVRLFFHSFKSGRLRSSSYRTIITRLLQTICGETHWGGRWMGRIETGSDFYVLYKK